MTHLNVICTFMSDAILLYYHSAAIYKKAKKVMSDWQEGLTFIVNSNIISWKLHFQMCLLM